MTTVSSGESKEDELLANLKLHEDKKLLDKTTFFTIAETILFNAFVGLIQDPKGLPGLYGWFPIIICGAGIVASVLWSIMIMNQINNTIKPLRKIINSRAKLTSFKTYFDIVKNKKALEIPAKAIPILFSIAWSLLLIVYSLHFAGILAINL